MKINKVMWVHLFSFPMMSDSLKFNHESLIEDSSNMLFMLYVPCVCQTSFSRLNPKFRVDKKKLNKQVFSKLGRLCLFRDLDQNGL